MISVLLVAPRDVPARLNGYAIQRDNDVTFVMRDDLTTAQLAAAITRMGALATGGRSAQR